MAARRAAASRLNNTLARKYIRTTFAAPAHTLGSLIANSDSGSTCRTSAME